MLAHPDAVVAALRAEPGMKVADFGAGKGSHAASLSAAVGHAGRVYLFDVQKPLVERLVSVAKSENLSNVDALWADLEVPKATGLSEGSLDRVLISHLLFQLDDRAAAIAEAFRVLKPGGVLLAVEWGPNSPAAAVYGERAVSPEALSALVSAAGFAGLSPAPVGSGQHAIFARKP